MEVTGTVVAMPYKHKELWSGLSGVLIKGFTIIDVVAVDFMNVDAQFFVIGSEYTGFMDDDMYLSRLYIKSPEGKLHPLKFNQWKSAIKSKLINTDQPVKYKMMPSKFSEGYFLKLCVSCGAHFEGSKRQLECEQCADINRVAQLVTDVKAKRPRIRKTNEDTI